VAKKNQGYERLKKKLEGLQKGKVAVDDIESAKQAEVDQHELEEESEEEDEDEKFQSLRASRTPILTV